VLQFEGDGFGALCLFLQRGKRAVPFSAALQGLFEQVKVSKEVSLGALCAWYIGCLC